MKKALLILMAIFICFTFSACAKKSVVGIEAETKELNIEIGEKRIVVARALPETADNLKIRWESSDPEVASVANGSVMGKSKGKCKVKAITRDGNFEATIDVTVRDKGLYVSKDFDKSTEGFGIWNFNTIGSALSAAENKDSVYIAKGEYQEIISVTKNVSIYGDGAIIRGGIIIGHPALSKPLTKAVLADLSVFSDDVNYPCVFIGSETENLTVKDCKFYGNGETRGIATLASGESGAISRIKITDCEFNNFKRAVDLRQYVAKSNVERNTFTKCEYATYFQGSQKIRVFQNLVKESGFIYFKSARLPAADIVIEENVIESGYKDLPLISAKAGDLDKSAKIKLKTNVFFGKKVENMNDAEKLELLKSIAVKNSITGGGTYDNIKLK